jgi:GT2 family glycosyltransferase
VEYLETEVGGQGKGIDDSLIGGFNEQKIDDSLIGGFDDSGKGLDDSSIRGFDDWGKDGGEEKGIDDSLIGGFDDWGKDGDRKSGVRVKIIKNKENLGFAAGNNQGMAAARGDYILLMNNDVVVTPGWLSRMVACSEKSPMIGIVGPKSNYVSGPQLVENVSYDTKDLNGLERYADEFAENNSGKATPCWRVVGFCMLIKRAVIDKIGGLDARYGLGNFEDDDFSLRARLAGYESRIAEDCFVHHFGNRTFLAAQIDYKKSLHKNWEIFKEKWGIPKNEPYGSSYDLSFLLKDGFIHSKHYFSIGETPDLQISKAIPEHKRRKSSTSRFNRY